MQNRQKMLLSLLAGATTTAIMMWGIYYGLVVHVGAPRQLVLLILIPSIGSIISATYLGIRTRWLLADYLKPSDFARHSTAFIPWIATFQLIAGWMLIGFGWQGFDISQTPRIILISAGIALLGVAHYGCEMSAQRFYAILIKNPQTATGEFADQVREETNRSNKFLSRLMLVSVAFPMLLYVFDFLLMLPLGFALYAMHALLGITSPALTYMVSITAKLAALIAAIQICRRAWPKAEIQKQLTTPGGA